MNWLLSLFGYIPASQIATERGWLKDALNAQSLAELREASVTMQLAEVDEAIESLHAMCLPGDDIPESTLDAARSLLQAVSEGHSSGSDFVESLKQTHASCFPGMNTPATIKDILVEIQRWMSAKNREVAHLQERFQAFVKIAEDVSEIKEQVKLILY
jgi:hypothetical protein